MWTGFVGSLVEAWSELRIHRTRVLLSLVGVGVAVTALTSVVAAGAIAEQAQIEQFERQGGRPALVTISAYDVSSGNAPDAAAVDDAFAGAADRYGIEWTSRVYNGMTRVQTPYGVLDGNLMLVDADFGTMHRMSLAQGSWFTERDELRLAPAVIVNEYLWNQLGAPPLATHPTVDIVTGSQPTTAVVVGVTPSPVWDEYPRLHALYSGLGMLLPEEEQRHVSPQFELWIPPEIAEELQELVRRDIAGALGEDVEVDAWRGDYLAWGNDDPFLILKLLVGGVAVLVLLLGALGLLNIALVTVRYRIREIGIRRSFGATAGRVFFSVMMESVVATTVAGIAGVALSVLLLKNPLTTEYVFQFVEDVPAFPVEAAVVGLLTAVAVGALAGLLPALVAVRVKVIDAIRY